MIARGLNMYFFAMIMFCGPSAIFGLQNKNQKENLDHNLYAMPLLIYNENEKEFQLNKDSVAHLKRLPAPIKVISAVGDARIGKSNAMSILANLIQKGNKFHYSTKVMPEIFKVSDYLEACTKGVWMHIISFEKNNYVLLDVEGTNLGDESITTTLSLFTAFLSSDIFLFVKETMNNHAINFLYHMARRREAQFNHLDRINFAKLTIVVRGALRPKKGSLRQFFIDSISKSDKGDGMDESRKVIGKQFPPEFVKVKELPYVDESFRTNIATFMNHDQYRETLEALADECTETLEEKRSIKGGRMDGEAIADVAQSILDMIRSDEWENWESDWSMFERGICKRSYERYIVPVDKLEDFVAIATAIPGAIKNFDKECVVKDEVEKASVHIERKLLMLKAQYELKKERAEWAEAEKLRNQRDERAEAEKLRAEAEEQRHILDRLQQQLVELEEQSRGGIISSIKSFFGNLWGKLLGW